MDMNDVLNLDATKERGNTTKAMISHFISLAPSLARTSIIVYSFTLTFLWARVPLPLMHDKINEINCARPLVDSSLQNYISFFMKKKIIIFSHSSIVFWAIRKITICGAVLRFSLDFRQQQSRSQQCGWCCCYCRWRAAVSDFHNKYSRIPQKM